MTWLVRTRPHFIVLFACGHVHSQCACGVSERGKLVMRLSVRCGACV